MTQRWNVKLLNKTVERELDVLQTRKRNLCMFVICGCNSGPREVGLPHIKHLTGELWEIRLSCKGVAARDIDMTVSEKTIMVVHLFLKKTQKTPKRALSLATQRIKEAVR